MSRKATSGAASSIGGEIATGSAVDEYLARLPEEQREALKRNAGRTLKRASVSGIARNNQQGRAKPGAL
jgi:hypothetical protein